MTNPHARLNKRKRKELSLTPEYNTTPAFRIRMYIEHASSKNRDGNWYLVDDALRYTEADTAIFVAVRTTILTNTYGRKIKSEVETVPAGTVKLIQFVDSSKRATRASLDWVLRRNAA